MGSIAFENQQSLHLSYCTNYINGMIGDIKHDIKTFWRYINGQRKVKHSISPSPFRTNCNLAITDLDKACAFNTQIKSLRVFTKILFGAIPLCRPNCSRMADITISTYNGVKKLLKGLNRNKTMGPHNVHPWVLSEVASDLAPVLSHLYQQYLSYELFPLIGRVLMFALFTKRMIDLFQVTTALYRLLVYVVTC